MVLRGTGSASLVFTHVTNYARKWPAARRKGRFRSVEGVNREKDEGSNNVVAPSSVDRPDATDRQTPGAKSE